MEVMKRKGRDSQLIARRNAKILERFIYWTEEQRLRSDDAVKILSEIEFFLTEQTIMKVLNDAYGDNVQVVFHQPKPPKLTQQHKELLKGSVNGQSKNTESSTAARRPEKG